MGCQSSKSIKQVVHEEHNPWEEDCHVPNDPKISKKMALSHKPGTMVSNDFFARTPCPINEKESPKDFPFSTPGYQVPDHKVVCRNHWCRQEYLASETAQHLSKCEELRLFHCFKCGDQFTRKELERHREVCHPEQCPHCGCMVIPRLLKSCPKALYSSKTRTVRPVVDICEMALSRAKVYKGPEEHAAAKIQYLYRLTKARKRFSDLIFRVVLREIEFAREQLIVGKRIMMKAVEESESPKTNQPRKRRSYLMTKCSKQDIPQGHYFPQQETVPLTLDVVRNMINDFESGGRLPFAAAWRVFDEALTHLMGLQNVQYINPDAGNTLTDISWVPTSRVVVVGDLHGQLFDLLHILKENGLPDSGANSGLYYIFNGDLVDRGANSVEVLLIVYTLMIVCPQNICVNRGNHEVYYMNEDYGFDVEVVAKYNRAMYHLIQKTFNALPLCVCIMNQVLVVHGGVPRVPETTLRFISEIPRIRPMPMPEENMSLQDLVFQDLLWADPSDELGIRESERGAGILFGKDVTERFLRSNKLKLIIRSHEPYLKGYEEHHDGKLITVFSASNYDGDNTNRASYAVIIPSRPDQPTFHTYRLRDLRELALNMKPLLENLEHWEYQHKASPKEEVLRYIRERIYIKRHELLKYFNALDVTRKGTVWKVEWVEAMRAVLCLNVPWFFLRMFLADAGSESRIKYTEFLARYQNRLMLRWTRQLEKIVLEKFASSLNEQRYKFRSETKNQNYLTFGEFERILHAMDVEIEDEELFQLFTFFDRDFLGHIEVKQLQSYLDAYANKQVADSPLLGPDSLWELQVMRELQNIFIGGRMSLEHAFRMMDKENCGKLNLDHFRQGMGALNRAMRKPLEDAQLQALYECMDEDKDGFISYEDFVHSFTVHDVVYEMRQIRSNSSFRNSFLKRRSNRT